MAEPDILSEAMKYVGGGAGGATVIGAFLAWLRNREAKEAREEFLELRADVKQLLKDVGEHKTVFADVVELKMMVSALHKRVDRLEEEPAKKPKGRG